MEDKYKELFAPTENYLVHAAAACWAAESDDPVAQLKKHKGLSFDKLLITSDNKYLLLTMRGNSVVFAIVLSEREEGVKKQSNVSDEFLLGLVQKNTRLVFVGAHYKGVTAHEEMMNFVEKFKLNQRPHLQNVFSIVIGPTPTEPIEFIKKASASSAAKRMYSVISVLDLTAFEWNIKDEIHVTAKIGFFKLLSKKQDKWQLSPDWVSANNAEPLLQKSNNNRNSDESSTLKYYEHLRELVNINDTCTPQLVQYPFEMFPEVSIPEKTRFVPIPKERKTYTFNMMVAGPSGSGKTTFVRAMYNKGEGKRIARSSNPLNEVTTAITKYDFSIDNWFEEGSNDVIAMKLYDTPGYGNEDYDKTVARAITFVQKKTLKHEKLVKKGKVQNSNTPLIHVCLYFISPHRCLGFDGKYMSALQPYVNVIPVLAKSDCYTKAELHQMKHLVISLLKDYAVNPFGSKLMPCPIFGIVGSENGSRQYHWGPILRPWDEHNKFFDNVDLRNLLNEQFHELRRLANDELRPNGLALIKKGATVKKKQESKQFRTSILRMIGGLLAVLFVFWVASRFIHEL